MERDEIIAAIRQTADENGGVPLGVRRFEQVAGVRPYDWEKYWARLGDAHREAGYEPNKLIGAYSDAFLLSELAGLARELGRFPTDRERRLKRRNDPTFPDSKVFDRFGSKAQLIARVLQYCRDHADFADVATLLESLEADSSAASTGRKADGQQAYGFVYLVKGHPGEYKIGRTTLVDRRLSELGATSAIEQKLVHEIKTDDPAGVEAYWHKRYQAKRMRGEWFNLTAADVKVFQRWRRIY
jgi:hypothetical protein